MRHDNLHIHWVSPVPPASTDIANYTIRVARALSKHCCLTLWTDTKNWSPEYEDICPIRYLNPDRVTPRDLFANSRSNPNAKNVIFIHIGNSWIFHSGFLRLAMRIPSIVVLHDLFVWELFREAISNGKFSKHMFNHSMQNWYSGIFQEMSDGHALPCFEPLLDKATAVLTHSHQAFEMVSARHFIPTYQLNLPFETQPFINKSLKIAHGPLRLLQFGYIGGPNRRLEQVLRALAELQDDVAFHFDVMGDLWNKEFVLGLISELGLERRVTLHGYVSDERLDTALANADLVFNLRFPTMGEASGSQLRIWSAKAASVVSDIGWYSELPSHSVYKVSVENEHAEIKNLVLDVSNNRYTSSLVGRNGFKHLHMNHSNEIYARHIIDIANSNSFNSRNEICSRIGRSVLSSSGSDFPYSHNIISSWFTDNKQDVK